MTGQVRPVVSLEVARSVLWFFGDTNLGVEPGSFVQRLLLAASAADAQNLEALRLGFPAYVHAFEMVARRPWGLDWLRGIVKDYLDGAEMALDFLAVES